MSQEPRDDELKNDFDDSPDESDAGGDAQSERSTPGSSSLQKISNPVRPRPPTTHTRKPDNFNDSNASTHNSEFLSTPSQHPHCTGSTVLMDDSLNSSSGSSQASLQQFTTSDGVSPQTFPDVPSTSSGNYGNKSRSNITSRSSTFTQQVSREELQIGEQARLLLSMFIQERVAQEHSPIEPVIRDICLADRNAASTGFTDETLSDIALTLRRIGDDISRNVELNNFIEQVPIDSTRDIFMKVCLQIFQDGNLNWGRIVALFYFAYRLIIKTLSRGLSNVPWVRDMMSWAVEFIVKHIAKWIIARGGWTMIKEWFGVSGQTLIGLSAVSLAMLLWAFFKKE